jgi:hypothetical protein
VLLAGLAWHAAVCMWGDALCTVVCTCDCAAGAWHTCDGPGSQRHMQATLYCAVLLLTETQLSLPAALATWTCSVVLPPLRLGTYALQSFTYSDSQHPEEHPVKANFVEIYAATDYVPQVRACMHASSFSPYPASHLVCRGATHVACMHCHVGSLAVP